ncbi:MAG TPA: VOC family protein [Amphiplicatus sp.]|nr:VOC family protein [Amphiplicatus sp.]HRX39197.1 VOC family protein [Parvularculaceae bacterium]
MPTVTPCLWFDNAAEEAATFYVSLFPNSKIGAVSRYGEEGREHHGKEPGTAMLVEFSLDGRPFQALNGGPHFKIDEAVSFSIATKDQAETDYYWNGLIANGGAESMCGWLKDRFGVSWQVVPTAFAEMMRKGDPDQQRRVMQAVFTMKKLDIAALEAAYRG